MAALDLLEEQPRRVEKLQANADALRDGLAREGFDTAGAQGHVVSIVVGDAERAQRIVDAAVEQGAFIEAVLPPAVPDGAARLRLAVMASHTRPELREAALVAGARVRAQRLPPRRGRPGRRRRSRHRRGCSTATRCRARRSSLARRVLDERLVDEPLDRRVVVGVDAAAARPGPQPRGGAHARAGAGRRAASATASSSRPPVSGASEPIRIVLVGVRAGRARRWRRPSAASR